MKNKTHARRHEAAQLEFLSDPAEAQAIARFRAFHVAHPDVWTQFKQVALQLIGRGYKHYSADGVGHIVRFNLSTSTDGHEPKINNNYIAYYARLWRAHFPQHADFFKTRKSSADQLGQIILTC